MKNEGRNEGGEKRRVGTNLACGVLLQVTTDFEFGIATIYNIDDTSIGAQLPAKLMNTALPTNLSRDNTLGTASFPWREYQSHT
jgi:hypothetical protein